MGKRSPIGEAALELCSKAKTSVGNNTLAKTLASEFNIPREQARSYIRYYRGNHGKQVRKYATSPRENGDAGWAPEMPPSLVERFEPFDLGSDLLVGILADVHVPFHSQPALSIAVSWLKKASPNVVVIAGDYGDWYSVSKFNKNPKYRNLKRELNLQRQGLAWLRGEFPDARIVMIKGNHDERWETYLWNGLLHEHPELHDEELLQFDTWLHANEHGVEIVNNRRPVLAGMLPIIHGHELPRGITNPVNMARGAFLRLSDTVLVAHGHRTSQHVEPTGIFHHEVATYSMGCLCDLYPYYNPIGNRWDNGFAFAEVDRDGEFDLRLLRITKHGKVRRG